MVLKGSKDAVADSDTIKGGLLSDCIIDGLIDGSRQVVDRSNETDGLKIGQIGRCLRDLRSRIDGSKSIVRGSLKRIDIGRCSERVDRVVKSGD